MATVNALLRSLFDLLLAPFSGLPAIVGVAVFSVLIGLFMLLVYKKTSNQTAIEAVKRRIYAGLFEIRLFNDDLGAILRAQGEILRHNLTYLRLSLVPLLVMIVPLTLVVAQLQFHWGYEGLEPGKPTLLKVVLKEGNRLPTNANGVPELALSAPEGVKVEAGPVWAAATREMLWRLSPERSGSWELVLEGGGERLTKTLVSSDEVVRRSPFRPAGGALLDQLLYPAEDPVSAASAVEEIHLAYQDAEVSLFGWKAHWLIHFVILSIVVAFALRKPLGVTF